MGKLEPSSTADGNVKCYRGFGKQPGGALKGSMWSYHMTQHLYSQVSTQEKGNVHTETCAWISIASLFTIAKLPKCASVDDWVHEMCSIYTVEYDSAMRRNGVLTHATSRMNCEYIMLWEKPDTDHILYGSIYTKCPEQTNP